ncbi:unnamed protein product [Owenia fusiformis]|uniref:Uncharacterized protein n=1 Tax=Owenia fusiformis TaxID=6347 RepID=A0A8J1UDJ8_OWEFU|nr:unnamed protein product [Owenia fusiformis]
MIWRTSLQCGVQRSKLSPRRSKFLELGYPTWWSSKRWVIFLQKQFPNIPKVSKAEKQLEKMRFTPNFDNFGIYQIFRLAHNSDNSLLEDDRKKIYAKYTLYSVQSHLKFLLKMLLGKSNCVLSTQGINTEINIYKIKNCLVVIITFYWWLSYGKF